MKKHVEIDERAVKELANLSEEVQAKFIAVFQIFSAFHKKTQKTPEKEIKTAEKRLRKHL